MVTRVDDVMSSRELFEYNKGCLTCFSLSKQREQALHRLGQLCGKSAGSMKKKVSEEDAGCFVLLHCISLPLVGKNLHDSPALWSSCFLCLERLKCVIYREQFVYGEIPFTNSYQNKTFELDKHYLRRLKLPLWKCNSWHNCCILYFAM